MSTSEQSTETVNHPSWYKGDPTFKHPEGIEVMDIIQSFKLGFRAGNVEKYLLRAGKKNPEKKYEDLMKSEFYIHDMVLNESDIKFTEIQYRKIEQLFNAYHAILKEAIENK